MTGSEPTTAQPRLAVGLGWLCAGTAAVALHVSHIAVDSVAATQLISTSTWKACVEFLGGKVLRADGQRFAEIQVGTLVGAILGTVLALWLTGAALVKLRRRLSWSQALASWARAWRWWVFAVVWGALEILAEAVGWDAAHSLLLVSPQFCYTVVLGGWAAEFLRLMARDVAAGHAVGAAVGTTPQRFSASFALVCLLAMVWAAGFTALNWQLYRGLLVPHGDSAMYEEHLWNLLHGKGFRSYLDQNLFLGEHIQVIHLLLIPAYIFWPSHLLLELCESVALAGGALPVFWMARRFSGSSRAGCWLAAAYLLYFPMQYLDIAVDLKTFRPISFGVPVLLFALDQYERRRYRTFGLLLVLALSAKEDFALIVAPLGIWLAFRHRPRWPGLALAATAAGYLVAATRLVIPWFRDGREVHYARYFSAFGDTLNEIAWSMLTRPDLLWEHLATPRTVLYAAALLVPLACLPLRSPGRLLVAVPLFGILCLNEIAQDPRHHFHAPLLPIVLWAAAAGLRTRADSDRPPEQRSLSHAHFACGFALFSGVLLGVSPLSLPFWDTGSQFHWRELYVPGERARQFETVEKLIPTSARVFSTDFVHPRFTHHERSYDYSNYPRPSDEELAHPKPGVEYYLVVDRKHRYSGSIIDKPLPTGWERVDHRAAEFFALFRYPSKTRPRER